MDKAKAAKKWKYQQVCWHRRPSISAVQRVACASRRSRPCWRAAYDFAIKTIQEATDSGIPQQFIGIDDGPASGGHDSNSFVFAFTLVPPKQASKHIAPFLLDANYTLSHPRNQ